MPKGSDLRDSFDRAAKQVESDVPRHLHQTLRIGRRRILMRRAAVMVAIAAAVAALVIAGPATLRWIDGPRVNTPAHTPTATRSATADGWAIAGSYSVLIPDAPGVIRGEGMAGSWTLRLEVDGTMLLSSPPSFTASITGVVFDLTGHQFRTNAFVTDLCGNDGPGLYRWNRSEGSLTFTVVSDPCDARVALFTTEPWGTSR